MFKRICLILFLSAYTAFAASAESKFQICVHNEKEWDFLPDVVQYVCRELMMDDLKRGSSKEYRETFANGKVMLEGKIVLGRPVGEWTLYREYGSIYARLVFDDGFLTTKSFITDDKEEKLFWPKDWKKKIEKSNPEYIASQRDLAFEHFKKREYDKALYEVRKIFTLTKNFKDAREIERYALEAIEKQKALQREQFSQTKSSNNNVCPALKGERGSVSFTTMPSSEATGISKNGCKFVLKTPVESVELPVGEYTVNFYNELLGMGKIIKITVGKGELLKVNENLLTWGRSQ